MKPGERDLRSCIHHLLHELGWTSMDVIKVVVDELKKVMGEPRHDEGA